MKFENRILKLPEGKFETEVQIFEKKDRETFSKIYSNWRTLSEMLMPIRSRAINLPEGLSEGAFCLEMDTVRVIKNISGANTSFDCYDFDDDSRIQVKACSVIPDLTSFGPKSIWDKIYFCDFYREGKWDGTFDIYLIDNKDVYNHEVKENETFREQQRQGRRPRFSIYSEIICVKGIKPVRTGKIFK